MKLQHNNGLVKPKELLKINRWEMRNLVVKIKRDERT